MNKNAENRLAEPLVKRVGDALITYSVSEREGVYDLFVSSSDTEEGSVCIRNFAKSGELAKQIRFFLAENSVSPLHVEDVLQDARAEVI